jgi:hypothetical protein
MYLLALVKLDISTRVLLSTRDPGPLPASERQITHKTSRSTFLEDTNMPGIVSIGHKEVNVL